MILKKTIYNDDKNYAPKEGEQIFGPNENRFTAAPPTVQAQMAMEDAAEASKRASEAVKLAGGAAEIANAIDQKVWEDDTGLHISSGRKDAAAEKNSIWNSLGMLFRKGLYPILGILTGNNPRVVVYDGNGSNHQNEVASFGSTAVVGQALNGKTRMVTAPEGIDLLRRENGSDVTLAHFGYDYGTPEEEGANPIKNPYYSLGYRSPNYDVGNWSIAEGDWTAASGFASHAEGSEAIASGLASHAEGVRTVASGTTSHAGGWETTANGSQSFAHGYQVQADFNQEFVVGRFNDTSLTPYINTIYVCDENDYDKATLTFPNTYGTYEGDFNVTYNGNFLPSPQCIYVTSTTITIVAAPLSSSGDGHFEDGDEIGIVLTQKLPMFVVGNGNGSRRSDAFSVGRDGDIRVSGNVYSRKGSTGKAYIGQVFFWNGNLKGNLTANAGAYVEAAGSITLPGGHTYLVIGYLAMTNSTNGTTNRRIQFFNNTAGTAVLTESKFVATQEWGTLQILQIFETSVDTALTVRGSASRPTTTIPTAWIRAVCIA